VTQNRARFPSLLLVAAALGACDAVAPSDYPGEPLLSLRGQVRSSGPLPPLEAAMLWQRGEPPSSDDQELATRAPVETGFPAWFTVHLYQPPPLAARRSLGPGEPTWARALAAALPYGIAKVQSPGAGAASNPGYGIDPDHWVLYLAEDVPAGSLTEWWLQAALPKGFHLLRVTAQPECLSAAGLAACIAELVQRGAPDDGTSFPGTARAFCRAPYRLAPAPGELLVLELGAIGLPTGGDCP
jgi:hypothetical protein